MKFWLKIIRDNNAFGIIFFLSLVIIIMGLLSPIFIIHIFNKYITYGLEGTLLFLVLGALIVAFFEFVFRNIRHNFFSKITMQPIKDLKLNILTNFFNTESITEKKNKLYEILDLNNSILKILSPQNQSNLIDSFFVLIVLIILFLLNFKLAVVFFIILVLILLLQNFFLNYKSRFRNYLSEKNSYNIFDDIKNKSFFLKIINAYKFVGFNLSKSTSSQLIDNDIFFKKSSFQMNLNHFFLVLTTIVIIGYGSTLVVNENLTIGTLIGFNIFSSRALQISLSAQKSISDFRNIDVYMDSIKEYFLKTKLDKTGMKLNKINGFVYLKNINFNSRGNSINLLNNLSLNSKPGQIFCISGSNGSGKSIICKMLTGIIKPISGEVLFDNINLEKLSKNWLREKIGYVPQNSYCLQTSILENISIGNKKLNDEEISRVAHSVGLDLILKKSNFNLTDTLKKNVSFGIHKKVHFARMIVRNAPIIIIDDPLEGMDTKGKEFIINLLKSYKKSNKTIICTSNDKEILNLSDEICDLDE